MPKEQRTGRRLLAVVALLQKLRLHARHIHVGRALALATLAGEAEVESLSKRIALKSRFGLGAGQKGAEDVGPTAGRILLIAGGHVAGAHRASGRRALSADARAVAKFGGAHQPALRLPFKIRAKLRRRLTRHEAKIGVD